MRIQLRKLALIVLGLAFVSVSPAFAQESPETPSRPPVVFGGYAEAFYQWNFNNPSNGLTNYRGFDNRHNTFSISNVALEGHVDYEGFVANVVLQVGATPSTYYLSEPALAGTGATSASGADVWKYIQQANAGYRFDVGRGLTVSAGLFLSPIGPEAIPVRDNWNQSRSNLFFGLPFYHTGLRAKYELTSEWSITVAGFNGWNSVVDGNDEKSIMAQLEYASGDLAASMLYFTGVERAEGAPEGRAWRHLFDAYATWKALPWLSLLGHADAGFERNEFGTSYWAAGALYARAMLHPQLHVAVRGDVFYENAASNERGTASAIFWPSEWVSSGTLTLDYRRHPQMSFRLEYRHDQAAGDTYYGGNVPAAADGSAPAPNRSSQDTLTAGATAWF